MSNRDAKLRSRVESALWGLFVGDALAMPVHWYYNVGNIYRDFKDGINGYEAPRHPHPEAFMVGMKYDADVESAQRLGRRYDILHEHVRFYDASYSPLEMRLADRESEHGNAVAAPDERFHYHHGLAAGDNTLAAHLVRVLMRSVIAEGGYDQDAFLEAFVDHMTTPGRNNDPYTEIYIRRWFENWTRGLPGYAAGDYQRRTWSIGSHGGIIRPLVLGMLPRTDYQAVGVGIEHHNLTHRSENNVSALTVFVPLLRALVSGAEAASVTDHYGRSIRLPRVTGRELYTLYRDHGGPGGIPRAEMWRLHTTFRDEPFEVAQTAQEFVDPRELVTRFATACYPEHGIPLALTIAHQNDYAPHAALVANANAGGDNVHRGMILGLLVGAAHPVPQDLRDGLSDAEAIAEEIAAFAELVSAG